MSFPGIHPAAKGNHSRDDTVFASLYTFFSRFDNLPSVHKLRKRFLSSVVAADKLQTEDVVLENVIGLYEEAFRITEQQAFLSEYHPDLLSLQRCLYRELEHMLSYGRNVSRHRFVIVIPVADRPSLLKNCLQSLVEQCQVFNYGGRSKDRYGKYFFDKITAVIVEDSRNKVHRDAIREIALENQSFGIKTYYVGLREQRAFLKQIPAVTRSRLAGLAGEPSHRGQSHKGASITRNIAYLYLKALSNELDGKILFYFMDSDEEFKVRVKRDGSMQDIAFINYFYWLDKIFRSSKASVLTGKVVGDPPVSPSVMVNTFLDDLTLFLTSLAELKSEDPCCFHKKELPGSFSAEYHDMKILFGYDYPSAPRDYGCQLSGHHTVKECFEDLSRKALSFFYGLHPSRPQFFSHSGDFSQTETARTVYTGNYVFTSEGLRHFLPFASLKLRMAGPTLGRILKSQLGDAFVSANLPVLHTRISHETNSHEFRSGVRNDDEFIDLSEEFRRQFWGDVMLFSVEALIKKGFPQKPSQRKTIIDTVNNTHYHLLDVYRKQQAATSAKNNKVRELLANPRQWLRCHRDMKQSIENLRRFCLLVKSNFGLKSKAFTELSIEADKGALTKAIADAIHSFAADKSAWEHLLDSDLRITAESH